MSEEKKSGLGDSVLYKGIRRGEITIIAVILACLGMISYAMIFFIQEFRRSNEYWGVIPAQMVILSAAAIIMTAGGFLFVWWLPHKYGRARIAELTDYLEQINVGGEVMVLATKEDEFSNLQDEMYKTVTELYRTREQAVMAKENYADNLANIAHQLKTPVTAAFLALQLPRGSQEKTQKNIDQVTRQLTRLQHLEEALLTLSRIDAGTLKLEHTQVDIYTVLNLAADNLDDFLTQRNISVLIPDHGCVTFEGDMEWTMEAMMNLMKNCVEHAPGGSTIHCDYSSNLLYQEIRIWDEGTGFAKEDIPHLFERFYRGQRSEKRQIAEEITEENTKEMEENRLQEINNDTGVGIGLSLARSILELQNGTITARNLPQGGACFEMKIYSH